MALTRIAVLMITEHSRNSTLDQLPDPKTISEVRHDSPLRIHAS